MSHARPHDFPGDLTAAWAEDLLEAAYAVERRGQEARAARLLRLRAWMLPPTSVELVRETSSRPSSPACGSP